MKMEFTYVKSWIFVFSSENRNGIYLNYVSLWLVK